jgi:RNA recognition motif-containing protein
LPICADKERCMQKKLYVGNLPYGVTEDALRELFAQAGTVVSVMMIKDRDSGRSKGFGFVEMSSQQEAEAAIRAHNGRTLGDRQLSVSIARPREERAGPPRWDNARRHDSRGRGRRH